jgi:hypothetical protein
VDGSGAGLKKCSLKILFIITAFSPLAGNGSEDEPDEDEVDEDEVDEDEVDEDEVDEDEVEEVAAFEDIFVCFF